MSSTSKIAQDFKQNKNKKKKKKKKVAPGHYVRCANRNCTRRGKNFQQDPDTGDWYCDNCWETFDHIFNESGTSLTPLTPFEESMKRSTLYYSRGLEEPECESSFCHSTVGLQKDPDTGTVYCAKCWERYEQSRGSRGGNVSSDEEQLMCMTKHCNRTHGLERDAVNGNMYCQKCWTEFDEHVANGYTSADAHTHMTGGSSDGSEALSSSEEEKEEQEQKQEQKEQQRSGDEPQPPSPTPDPAAAVYDRLYHSASERRLRRKQATAKKEADALSKLSFKPSIPQRIGASHSTRRRKCKPLHERLHDDHARRARNMKRLRQDTQSERDNLCTFNPTVPSLPGSRGGGRKRSVFSRMSKDIKNRQGDGVRRKDKLKAEHELQDCTFQPRSSGLPNGRRSRNKVGVVQRLTRRKREDVYKELEDRRLQEELQECTFKPEIDAAGQHAGRFVQYGTQRTSSSDSRPSRGRRRNQKESVNRLSKPVVKEAPEAPVQCTFHPSISAKSALIAPVVISHYEDSDDDALMPPRPQNVWESLHQTRTKNTDMQPTGTEYSFEPQLSTASRRKLRHREDRVNDRLFGAKPKPKPRSRLHRLLAADEGGSQENTRSQPVVMRVGSPRYRKGSYRPKREASAVVVKDVTELMRTSAAMDIRSKKSSQRQATERLTSRRPYIAPVAPSNHETVGASLMRGWEKRGVFGVLKARKEW